MPVVLLGNLYPCSHARSTSASELLLLDGGEFAFIGHGASEVASSTRPAGAAGTTAEERTPDGPPHARAESGHAPKWSDSVYRAFCSAILQPPYERYGGGCNGYGSRHDCPGPPGRQFRLG